MDIEYQLVSILDTELQQGDIVDIGRGDPRYINNICLFSAYVVQANATQFTYASISDNVRGVLETEGERLRAIRPIIKDAENSPIGDRKQD